MHFGSRVREVLTASCGVDFRASRPRTELDVLQTASAQQALISNLELAFGIRVSQEEVTHLQTVRDLLQCVRVHLWEQRVTAGERAAAVPVAHGRPGFVPLPPSLRETSVRLTPTPPLGAPIFTADRRLNRT